MHSQISKPSSNVPHEQSDNPNKTIVSDSHQQSNHEIIQHLAYLLDNSKLDQAGEYLEQHEAHANLSLTNDLRFQQIKYRVNVQQTKLSEIQELLYKSTGWVLNHNKQDYKVHYKQRVDKKGFYVKFQTKLDIKPFGLFSILVDHSSYKSWMPFCKQANLVKQIGVSDKVFHFRSEFPVISTREAILYGFAVNRLSIDDTILIIAYSVNDCKEFQDKLGLDYNQFLKSGSVFIDLPQFCFVLDMKEYKQDELCKNASKVEDRQCYIPVDSILSVNPSISWIPQSMMDYMLNMIIKDLFKQIIKASLKYSEQDYNPECQQFYDQMRQMINEYINQDKQ